MNLFLSESCMMNQIGICRKILSQVKARTQHGAGDNSSVCFGWKADASFIPNLESREDRARASASVALFFRQVSKGAERGIEFRNLPIKPPRCRPQPA
jgi:hypothetical protein